MADALIPLAAANDLADAAERWSLRAAQARRIAGMLRRGDAEVLEAYADECDREAGRLSAGREPVPLAA